MRRTTVSEEQKDGQEVKLETGQGPDHGALKAVGWSLDCIFSINPFIYASGKCEMLPLHQALCYELGILQRSTNVCSLSVLYQGNCQGIWKKSCSFEIFK